MTADKLKKRNEIENYLKAKKIQTRSIIYVVAIYFAMLITLVQLTIRLNLPLTVEHMSSQQFTPWFWILLFAYYALPVAVALLAGYAFRPFWLIARNVFWVIILIHGAYSFLAFALRADYYDEWNNNIRQSHSGDLKIKKFKQGKIDKNQDGIIEKVQFKTQFDMSDFPGGQYLISLYLTQFQKRLPGNLGVYKFIVIDQGQELLNTNFSFNPQRYNQYFARGPVDVNIELKKIIAVDEEGGNIANICRWAAFYRPVSWTGKDTRVYNDIISLQQIPDVDEIALLPLNIEQPKFTQKSIKDFGRDLNANGLFDELIIEVILESDYEGLLYLGVWFDDKLLSPEEKIIRKGVQTIAYSIAGALIRNHEKDGPFQVQLMLSSDDLIRHAASPGFTTYLNEHRTNDYARDQYE